VVSWSLRGKRNIEQVHRAKQAQRYRARSPPAAGIRRLQDGIGRAAVLDLTADQHSRCSSDADKSLSHSTGIVVSARGTAKRTLRKIDAGKCPSRQYSAESRQLSNDWIPLVK